MVFPSGSVTAKRQLREFFASRSVTYGASANQAPADVTPKRAARHARPAQVAAVPPPRRWSLDGTSAAYAPAPPQ